MNKKEFANIAGKFAWKATKKSFKIGKQFVTSDWTKDVVKGAAKTTYETGKVVAKTTRGVVNTGVGAWKEDPERKNKGISEVKEMAVKTGKGVINSLEFVVDQSSDIVKGAVTKDKKRVKNAAYKLTKGLAIGGIGLGVLDLLDIVDIDGDESVDSDHDTDEIAFRNEDLVDHSHPVTDIEFHERILETPEGDLTGVFPDFESNFIVELPTDMYLNSDQVQFSFANDELYQAIIDDPSLIDELDLSDSEVENLSHGITPDGFTWHHNEEMGKLELVDEEIHAATGHTGGRELWGS